MNTHENDTELDTAYWEGRAEEAKNSSALLAKSNERIAALEKELAAERHLRNKAEEEATLWRRKHIEALGQVAAMRQAARSVYEIVDVTDEETYYTIGLWSTLEDAKAICRLFANDPDGLNKSGGNDYCRIVIRHRPVGQYSEEGTDVAEFVWCTAYDEEQDDWAWTMQEVK